MHVLSRLLSATRRGNALLMTSQGDSLGRPEQVQVQRLIQLACTYCAAIRILTCNAELGPPHVIVIVM